MSIDDDVAVVVGVCVGMVVSLADHRLLHHNHLGLLVIRIHITSHALRTRWCAHWLDCHVGALLFVCPSLWSLLCCYLSGGLNTFLGAEKCAS